MTALITYEHLHGLGRRDPQVLYTDLAACMKAFGYAEDPSEALVKLDMRDGGDAALRATYEELARAYGPYPKKLLATHVTDGDWSVFFWQIPPGELDSALVRVIELQDRGGLLESRTGLKLVWKFRLRDPDTRELLPGQDALPRLENFPGGHGDSSSVVLNLGRPSSVSLWFLFPFLEPDATFRQYVGRLQAALPVSLSAKGWRHWKKTRSGTWRASKLAPELGERGRLS